MNKIGIVLLVHLIIGLVFAESVRVETLPAHGGVEGNLNSLYVVFTPVMSIYYLIRRPLSLM